MAASKRLYEDVAQRLGRVLYEEQHYDSHSHYPSDVVLRVMDRVLDALTEVFSEDNPRFSPDRFQDAMGNEFAAMAQREWDEEQQRQEDLRQKEIEDRIESVRLSMEGG